MGIGRDITRIARMLCVSTACLAGAAPALHAQLIEISIEVRDETLGSASAVVLFDTASAPVDGTATTVTFDAYDASMSVEFADFYAHSPGYAEQIMLRKASAASLRYSTQDREIVVRIEAPGCSLELEIESPVGPFHPSMTALPSNPTAYLFDGFDTEHVHATFTKAIDEQTQLEGEAQWNPIDAFTGAITYTIRALPAPEPQPCTEADLAPPFGVLDFDDVLAFLDSFNAGCP